MFVSIIMRSLPWAMPFGLNALLLHFDLETALGIWRKMRLFWCQFRRKGAVGAKWQFVR
ncbi:MAG: hypothetical protein VB141_06200 [Burkholderia gladioli]